MCRWSAVVALGTGDELHGRAREQAQLHQLSAAIIELALALQTSHPQKDKQLLERRLKLHELFKDKNMLPAINSMRTALSSNQDIGACFPSNPLLARRIELESSGFFIALVGALVEGLARGNPQRAANIMVSWAYDSAGLVAIASRVGSVRDTSSLLSGRRARVHGRLGAMIKIGRILPYFITEHELRLVPDRSTPHCVRSQPLRMLVPVSAYAKTPPAPSFSLSSFLPLEDSSDGQGGELAGDAAAGEEEEGGGVLMLCELLPRHNG